MNATTTATRTAKSVAPGQSAAVKVAAGEVLFPTITVVMDRSLRNDQSWFEGDGRGYVREFIVREGYAFCTACGDEHEITAFPTFSVPRQDGRTRGTVCREQVRTGRKARKAAAFRKARAQKAAAASAKVRAAKAAARKAAAQG